MLEALERLSYDPADVAETRQRTISLREFNRSALGLSGGDDRVSKQCGQRPTDIFSENILNAQIVRIMREHHLFERYGLSYPECLAMRADEWNRFVKTLEQPYLKRSVSSGELIATVLQRLETVFTLFIAPKKEPPKNGKSKP